MGNSGDRTGGVVGKSSSPVHKFTHTGTRTPHSLCFSLVPRAGPVLGLHSISSGRGLDARPIMK